MTEQSDSRPAFPDIAMTSLPPFPPAISPGCTLLCSGRAMLWGRRLGMLLAVSLTGAFLAAAGGKPVATPTKIPGPIHAEVLRVVDGDTMKVRALIWLDQAIETSIRVDGIDTPERRSKCNREKQLAEVALDYTRQAVSTGTVTLHDVQYDKFGRRVRARVVTQDGQDLAKGLIEAGLARPYKGDKRKPWC